MVVSIDIYLVLTVASPLLAIAYSVFHFYQKRKTFSIVIRLICAFAIVVIEAFKMPIYIAMDKSCANAIFIIIIWLAAAVISSFQLGQNIWTTKKRKYFLFLARGFFFYKFVMILLQFIKIMIYFSKLIVICINRQESPKVVNNYFVGTTVISRTWENSTWYYFFLFFSEF